MRFRQRVGVFFAAFILALGLGAIYAAPAQASTSSCNYNYFCIWTNGSWSNAPAWQQYIPAGVGGLCLNFNNLNDQVDSAYIFGSNPRSVTIYENINCSGAANYFLQTAAFGGPSSGSCTWPITDYWGCNVNQSPFGHLPSSAWILRA